MTAVATASAPPAVAPRARKPLKDRDLALLAYMHDFFHVNHQLPGAVLIAEKFQSTVATAYRRLEKMEDAGYIEKNEAEKYRFVGGRATIMFQGNLQ